MSSDPHYIVFGLWQDVLHQGAMLDADATVAGVGCMNQNGIYYWSFDPGIGPVPPPSGTPTLDSVEWAFLALINSYRAQNGAGLLKVSATLQASSEWMSNDMATNAIASHIDSLGRSPAARMAAFGYTCSPTGENILGGYPGAQTAFNSWRDACDPDNTGTCTYAHRRNMLNPYYQAIRIGRVYNASSVYGWYWTTDFGACVDNVINPPAPGSPVISSFTATPAAIAIGRTSTIALNVSGATSVTIDNGIGTVAAVSSVAVQPSQTTYHLTAITASGTAMSHVSVTVSASPTPDTQPPSTPSLTGASAVSATRVNQMWSRSADNVGVTGYEISRNGALLASVAGSLQRIPI